VYVVFLVIYIFEPKPWSLLNFCTGFAYTYTLFLVCTQLRYNFFFLSWRLQSAHICDRLCHILSLLRVVRNIGFYLTAMFINTVSITVIGY